jgi:superfamily I DNA and/or RNA helicase
VIAEDILVVAPYNMQVRALRAALPAGVRVGSVDKFQGQEAPIAIVSTCASSGDCVPRGVEFLLSVNRLNVALSRAQSLAIVVGSPQLARARVSSVEQMRLVSFFFCRVMGA